MKMVEMLARNIASALGDDFDAAFDHKSEWVQSRGGTPFRDINMPFKSDYIDAAQAALRAMETPTPEMVEAAIEGTGPVGCCCIDAKGVEEIWSAMIVKAREG